MLGTRRGEDVTRKESCQVGQVLGAFGSALELSSLQRSSLTSLWQRMNNFSPERDDFRPSHGVCSSEWEGLTYPFLSASGKGNPPVLGFSPNVFGAPGM